MPTTFCRFTSLVALFLALAHLYRCDTILLKIEETSQKVEYFTKFPSTVIIGKKAEFCIQFEDVEKYESNINLTISSYRVAAFNPVNLVIGYKTKSFCLDIKIYSNPKLHSMRSTLKVTGQTINKLFEFEEEKTFKIVDDEYSIFLPEPFIFVDPGIKPVETTTQKTTEPQRSKSNFWTIECKENKCSQAFTLSAQENCYGAKECKEIVDSHFPQCSHCTDLLTSKRNLKNINRQKHLLCDEKNEMQVLGCAYFCRARFYSKSECMRELGTPICRCYSKVTEPKKVLVGTHDSVRAVLMLPNGELVSSSDDSVINVWSVNTEKIKRKIEGHSDSVNQIRLLGNGDLMSSSHDKTLKIWNAKDGSLKKTISLKSGYSVDFLELPNEEFASASSDGSLEIWSLNQMNLKAIIKNHTSSILCMVLLPDGQLVTGSSDNNIRIWNLNERSVKQTLTGHTGAVLSLHVLSNGDIVSGSNDTTIRIWNLSEGKTKQTLKSHFGGVQALTELPNGFIASGSQDNTIKFWNPADATPKYTFYGHDGGVTSLAVLPNGDLASASEDTLIFIWSTSSLFSAKIDAS